MNKIMGNKKNIVIGVGELLWDMLPSGKMAGGAPVNFAFHAGQTGTDAYAISALGNDKLGEELVAMLEAHHINHIIEQVDYPTGRVEVSLANGIPQYSIERNVAWDYLPITNRMLDLANQADAICYGTLALRSSVSQGTILQLLEAAKESKYRLLDINLRQNFYSKELIDILLEKSNALKINEEELDVLRSMFDLVGSTNKACIQLMKQFNLRLLILTAGADFSALFTSDQLSHIDTPKVNIVDTIGAGDCFSGVLIGNLLQGISLKKAHEKAVNIAAHICRYSGAWIPHSTFTSLSSSEDEK